MNENNLSYACRLNKGFNLQFSEGYPDQETLEEGNGENVIVRKISLTK